MDGREPDRLYGTCVVWQEYQYIKKLLTNKESTDKTVQPLASRYNNWNRPLQGAASFFYSSVTNVLKMLIPSQAVRSVVSFLFLRNKGGTDA